MHLLTALPKPEYPDSRYRDFLSLTPLTPTLIGDQAQRGSETFRTSSEELYRLGG